MIFLTNSAIFSFSAVDVCQSSPCQNGAACTNQCPDYECTCLDGFIGDNCETGKHGGESEDCALGGHSQEFFEYFE